MLKNSSKQTKPKNYSGMRVYGKVVLQDAVADEIVFPEVPANENPDIGDKAEINEKPAKGDYLMPDGRTFVFKDGILRKIKPDPEDALVNIKNYLAKKRNKVNPTATPDNRAAGISERVKALKFKGKRNEK